MKIQFLWLSACFVLAACSKPANPQTTEVSPTKVKNELDSVELSRKIEEMTPENHMGIMELILGKPKYPVRTIGILVYDGANDLDIMGPRYVLGQAMGVKTMLVGTRPGTFKTVMGVQIMPDTTIENVSQLDILIIPGGFKGTIEAAYDQKLHDWIRKIDKKSVFTGSVCTGGWILGATGLLKGKKASTNWYREEEFLEKYGAIPANQRYTRDGKYWTSAGVTAGMDMSLAIIQEIYGDRYAQAVMLDMEYDPHPPVVGGTPEKTGWGVHWMMKEMYDGGIQPLVDSLENRR